jgi:hypothetical protein
MGMSITATILVMVIMARYQLVESSRSTTSTGTKRGTDKATQAMPVMMPAVNTPLDFRVVVAAVMAAVAGRNQSIRLESKRLDQDVSFAAHQKAEPVRLCFSVFAMNSRTVLPFHAFAKLLMSFFSKH